MQKTGIEVFSFMPKGTRPLLIWSVILTCLCGLLSKSYLSRY